TPIYYVNAEPHLGHAYTTIGTDIIARHMRQRGEDVFFLTGTDEHGEPVAQVAEREGISPRELADRNVVHFQELVRRINATNDFFMLSKYQEQLERLYAEQPEFVMPRNRYNEALAFIKQGLSDISVTRAKLHWGVRVPWDESQVIYVWFDALLNYVTALKYARANEDLTDSYWPATYHLIGKDILKFHAVYWPALLMAAGLEVPQHLFVHGFLLMDDKKMS